MILPIALCYTEKNRSANSILSIVSPLRNAERRLWTGAQSLQQLLDSQYPVGSVLTVGEHTTLDVEAAAEIVVDWTEDMLTHLPLLVRAHWVKQTTSKPDARGYGSGLDR